MSSLSYIERNRDFVTASKLKTFIKSPEAYYLEYIKEIAIEREDSAAFILGTAFDDALTYWPAEFQKKYFIDEGLTVSDMVAKCYDLGIPVDAKESKTGLMRKLYWAEFETKIRLTASNGVALTGMLHEAGRQPLWDLWGEYEKQAKIEALYKGKLKLRGTLDRLSVQKALIRDYKTTSSLKDFTFKLSDKYGYDKSMAFYYMLVKMIRGVDCDVVLEVVQSSGHFQSEVFQYQKERMEQTLNDTIFPALDLLLEMTLEWEATGDEAVWTSTKTENRYELFDLDTYPYLESGKQEKISYI